MRAGLRCLAADGNDVLEAFAEDRPAFFREARETFRPSFFIDRSLHLTARMVLPAAPAPASDNRDLAGVASERADRQRAHFRRHLRSVVDRDAAQSAVRQAQRLSIIRLRPCARCHV